MARKAYVDSAPDKRYTKPLKSLILQKNLIKQ